MYLNELDNFHFDLPDRGSVPQVAVGAEALDGLDLSSLPIPATSLAGTGGTPQIGSLSPADEALFRGVIAKYFSEEDPLCPIRHLPHNGENHPGC